jgi:hypothetical protein
MDFIKSEEIVIPPNRQRREFDPRKITDLADSIQVVGLMHAVVVQNDGRTLVAGERRIKAMKQLHFLGKFFKYHGAPVFQGEIPVVKLGELSPAEVYEAELAENTIREDLSWQEKAEAVAKLQELRQMQRGAPVTPKEIALEVNGKNDGGGLDDKVRQQLLVAKHLNNPEVAKSKTLKDALTVLKTRERQDNLAIVGASLPPEVLAQKHRLIIGDFNSADLPSGRYTVTITDPPYGIEMQDAGGVAMGAVAGHTYNDSATEWPDLMKCLALKLWGVGAENSHHYVFCDFEKFVELRSIFSAMGFRVFRTPFVMCRTSSVRAPWKEEGPWKSTEYILYAIKGTKPTQKWGPDFIVCRGDENLGHGAQKPVSVYVDLLERSAKPGEEVIDLCAGTGTIFPAAHQLKLIATGVELSPQNAAICAERLKSLPTT